MLAVHEASQVPAGQHPAAVYLARLAPGSRRSMRQALYTIAGILHEGADAASLPWQGLRYQHAQAVRAELAERFAPATANKILSALRGVLQEAWRLGLLPSEDYQRAADLPGVKGTTLPRGRALQATEIRSLLVTEGDSPSERRDRALVALLYGAGLRRSEAVALEREDWNADTRELTVRHGKGNKARLCHLPHGSAVAMARWLEVRGQEPGPLFVGIRRGGHLQASRLTDQAILHILAKRGGAAGLAAFSPHDLRRSMISDLLDAGADIATVQKIAGHANVSTTARYDRRGEHAKRRAAELLEVPTC